MRVQLVYNDMARDTNFEVCVVQYEIHIILILSTQRMINVQVLILVQVCTNQTLRLRK